ncbi:hypothetical protein [Bacillus infantis]|uniref:hypothetical protein n=1 Tax=Bacillus infantis TaxID=324767 RepID=UPI003CE8BB69
MSFITLELDTTPPEIEIYSPTYVTRETDNLITIIGSEELSTYQEIYIVDSQGNRFDYTFTHDNNSFVGKVKLNELSLGTATLYVRVKDTVDNISELKSHMFEIKENISRLRMSISHGIHPLFVETTSMNIETKSNEREMIIYIET